MRRHRGKNGECRYPDRARHFAHAQHRSGRSSPTARSPYARTASSRSARRRAFASGSRARRRIDASMRLVMPGLVDGHAHLGEIARGLIPDTLRTSDWLKFWCYPYMAAITEEDEYWYSKCLMAEMIRSGTTCFVEPGCMWLDTTIKAIEEAGMRATTGSWVWDHAGPDGHKCPEYFKKMTLQQWLDLTESNIKAYRRHRGWAHQVLRHHRRGRDLLRRADARRQGAGRQVRYLHADAQGELARGSGERAQGDRPPAGRAHVSHRRAWAERLSQSHDRGRSFRGRHAGGDRHQGLPEPARGAQARQGYDADEPFSRDAGERRYGLPRLRRRQFRRPQGHVPLDVSRGDPAQGRQDRSRGHYRRGGDRDGDACRLPRGRLAG